MSVKDNLFHTWVFMLSIMGLTGIIILIANAGCVSKSDITTDFTGVVPLPGKIVYHTVKEGETLWRIARKYGVSVDRIAGVNGLENPTMIIAGSELIIPLPAGEKIPDMPVEKPIKFADENSLAWPLEGEITDGFNTSPGDKHDGIDIRAPEGTIIRAAADGKVAYSGEQFQNYGKMLIIEHSETLSTLYAHCSVLYVYEGDVVTRGHIIAKVGKTGNATGPHLHFEIRLNNAPVDPLKYLPAR